MIESQMLSNIYDSSTHGDLEWKTLRNSNVVSVYSSRKQISKEKYLTLFLFVYKNHGMIKLGEIKLEIKYTNRKDTIKLKDFVADDYPILVDIFDIIDVDF